MKSITAFYRRKLLQSFFRKSMHSFRSVFL